MKKVLFLDDSQERIKAATIQYKDFSLYITETAIQCIKTIQGKDKWDIVSLDHDLGGKVFVGSDREDCGMEVVRWVVENKPNVELFIVHSWNVPAARRMDIDLREAGYFVERKMFGM